MAELMQYAANFCFPMVVAGYLLVRLEPLIKELQKTITVLTIVVARQSGVDYEDARQLAADGK